MDKMLKKVVGFFSWDRWWGKKIPGIDQGKSQDHQRRRQKRDTGRKTMSRRRTIAVKNELIKNMTFELVRAGTDTTFTESEKSDLDITLSRSNSRSNFNLEDYKSFLDNITITFPNFDLELDHNANATPERKPKVNLEHTPPNQEEPTCTDPDTPDTKSNSEDEDRWSSPMPKSTSEEDSDGNLATPIPLYESSGDESNAYPTPIPKSLTEDEYTENEWGSPTLLSTSQDDFGKSFVITPNSTSTPMTSNSSNSSKTFVLNSKDKEPKPGTYSASVDIDRIPSPSPTTSNSSSKPKTPPNKIVRAVPSSRIPVPVSSFRTPLGQPIQSQLGQFTVQYPSKWGIYNYKPFMLKRKSLMIKPKRIG